MNILIAKNNGLNPMLGGVSRVSLSLAKGFRQQGHKVSFIAFNKFFHTKEMAPLEEQVLLPDLRIAYSEENIRFFCSFIKKHAIDIVLNQEAVDYSFSKLCIEVRKRMDIKLISALHFNPGYTIDLLSVSYFTPIYTIKDLENNVRAILRFLFVPWLRGQRMKYCHKLYSEIYEGSDALVLLSDSFVSRFCELLHQKKTEKLYVIPNPLSFDSPSVIPFKNKQLLFVGRLVFSPKRPDYLLKIWKQLYPQFPDWNLTLVGEGPYRHALENIVKSMHLERVCFVGQTDPVSYYTTSSILCMTSTFEGFGMVLTEAQQFGTIPFAFNSFTALPDIVHNEVDGCIIAPYNLEEYATRLSDIMSNEQRRQFLSKNAFENAKRFNLQDVCERWIQLFEAL